jgi:hypothetical protein
MDKMDFALKLDYDDNFWYLRVGTVTIAFRHEDLPNVIGQLQVLQDDMLACGSAS